MITAIRMISKIKEPGNFDKGNTPEINVGALIKGKNSPIKNKNPIDE